MPAFPGCRSSPDERSDIRVTYLNDGSNIVALHAGYSVSIERKGRLKLTPPIDRGAEIRCYMREPDGYLIEVGQLVGRPDS